MFAAAQVFSFHSDNLFFLLDRPADMKRGSGNRANCCRLTDIIKCVGKVQWTVSKSKPI